MIPDLEHLYLQIEYQSCRKVKSKKVRFLRLWSFADVAYHEEPGQIQNSILGEKTFDMIRIFGFVEFQCFLYLCWLMNDRMIE